MPGQGSMRSSLEPGNGSRNSPIVYRCTSISIEKDCRAEQRRDDGRTHGAQNNGHPPSPQPQLSPRPHTSADISPLVPGPVQVNRPVVRALSSPPHREGPLWSLVTAAAATTTTTATWAGAAKEKERGRKHSLRVHVCIAFRGQAVRHRKAGDEAVRHRVAGNEGGRAVH